MGEPRAVVGVRAGRRPTAFRLAATALLGIATIGVAGACGPVGALHLTVSTSADGRDATIGDRICEVTPGVGDCTLRAAIDETNVLPYTTDVIDIAPGIDPTLTLAGTNDDTNATGDLDITGTVTIQGAGATIDAARLDRVIDHLGATLVLHDLTITGGEQSGDGPDEKQSHGPIVVPGNGGFGTGAGIRSAAPLTVTGSTITDNRILYQPVLVPGAGLDLTGSPVRITGSTISDNLEYAFGVLGGGLAARGVADLTISTSAVQGNEIRNSSGGFETFGAGILLQGSVASIDRSTIAANVAASSDGAGTGAGIYASSSPLTITRSTVSGNGSNDALGVEQVDATGGSVSIIASTIVGSGDERSLRASSGTIRASVVTGRCEGSFTSGGWNVAGPVPPFYPNNGCGTTQPTDLTVADVLLGPLADYGGPTLTHLPAPGSPVIDRIPTGSPQVCSPGGTDQRGLPAPAGAGCDVGAVEVQP